MRSQSTYTQGTVEAIAQFGSGTFQHIGFGSDSFVGNRYFIFRTTKSTTNLFARVNNNGSEEPVDLGAIPAGFHRRRVEWIALDDSSEQVIFLIDGVQVAQMIVANAVATDFYLYLSNNGADNLQVDSAQVVPTYVPSGSYTSCALDAGVGQQWQTINWDSTLPLSTTLTVQTRTSVDGLA